MSRKYDMSHRVSYAQIIDVLRDTNEPLFFDELYDLLPCEPDYTELQLKLNNMVAKGMIVEESIFCDIIENSAYSLPIQ